MPKVKVEVELEVPEGYRAVYRTPKKGEVYIANNGLTHTSADDLRLTKFFVLEPLGPPYVFPDWMLKSEGSWLYRNRCGWFVSPKRPALICDEYLCSPGTMSISVERMKLLLHGTTEFIPPSVKCIQIARPI